MNKEPALLSKMQTELLRLMVPCSLKTRCLTDTSIQIYLETYWMSYHLTYRNSHFSSGLWSNGRYWSSTWYYEIMFFL